MDHLFEDLGRAQIPFEALAGREAEAAPHGAAHLGGDAEGEMAALREQHGFDPQPVRELEEELAGAVPRALELQLAERALGLLG
jgi:hypothetical protein